MKIAMFLTGRITCYENNVNLIKYITKHNIDVFASVNDPTVDYKFLYLYNVKKYNFERYKIGTEQYEMVKKHAETRYPEHILSSYYNKMKCMEMLEEYEIERDVKYDIILCFRADILFENDDNLMHFNIEDYFVGDLDIHIPDCNDAKGINDMIAYGKKPGMKLYCNLYKSIFDYYEKNKIEQAEQLLKLHLNMSKLNIVRYNFNYKLDPGRHAMVIKNKFHLKINYVDFQGGETILCETIDRIFLEHDGEIIVMYITSACRNIFVNIYNKYRYACLNGIIQFELLEN